MPGDSSFYIIILWVKRNNVAAFPSYSQQIFYVSKLLKRVLNSPQTHTLISGKENTFQCKLGEIGEKIIWKIGQLPPLPDISENWQRVNSIIFNTGPLCSKGFRREFVIASEYWLLPKSPQIGEIVQRFMGYLFQIYLRLNSENVSYIVIFYQCQLSVASLRRM